MFETQSETEEDASNYIVSIRIAVNSPYGESQHYWIVSKINVSLICEIDFDDKERVEFKDTESVHDRSELVTAALLSRRNREAGSDE